MKSISNGVSYSKMRSISASSLPEVETEDCDESDYVDAKETWLVTGEMAKFIDAKQAFQAAGYRVRRAELMELQPAWVFCLVRVTAPLTGNENGFRNHVRDILWQVRMYYRDEDLMIHLGRRHIILSFLWPVPACSELRIAAWDEGRLQLVLSQLP
jgi:hypothetical protein